MTTTTNNGSTPSSSLRLADAAAARMSANRRMTKTFKALSDGTRRRILELLEERASPVGKLVEHFELSQPTISRHLSILRQANLVIDERRGQSVIYRLNHAELASTMQRFFGQFESCEQLLKPEPEATASNGATPDA